MPQKPSKLGTPKELAALVSKLLSHYWTADDPVPARSTQIEDWIEDVREFPLAIVEASIDAWRRSQSRRPLPADIRKLCIEEQSEQQFNALPRPNLTDDEIERNASHIANRWAQGQGFSSIEAWQNSPVTAQDLAIRVAPGVTRYFRKNRHNDAAIGRNIIDRWAQQHGYRDLDDMAAQQGKHWSELYQQQIRETLQHSPIAKAAILNAAVTTKPEFNPSQDQLAQARRELGLDAVEVSATNAEEVTA